jgi:hypothetical protein
METLSDLAEAEVGVVVEADDSAFAFREARDDSMQGPVAFMVGSLLEGIGVCGGEKTGESERVLIGLRRVEREDGSAGNLGLELFEFRQGETEGEGEFVASGGTAQAGFESEAGFAEAFLPGSHQTGCPVGIAECFENGATNEGNGIGLELDVACRIEGIYGTDEAEEAGSFEIIAIQKAQQAGREALDGGGNEEGVALNETGAGLLTTIFPEATP